MIVVAFTAALAFGLPQTPAQEQAITDKCVTPQEQTLSTDQVGEARRLEIIACITAEVAKLVNADLPQQIDESTTLTSVEAAGVNLTYNNQVEVKLAEVTDAMRAAVSESVSAQVCQQSDMAAMISLGATYTYVWRDRDGRTIHRLNISAC